MKQKKCSRTKIVSAPFLASTTKKKFFFSFYGLLLTFSFGRESLMAKQAAAVALSWEARKLLGLFLSLLRACVTQQSFKEAFRSTKAY